MLPCGEREETDLGLTRQLTTVGVVVIRGRFEELQNFRYGSGKLAGQR